MRMFVKVSIPVAHGNKAIQDGSMGKIIGTFLETWKPEAAYFGVEDGQRTGFFVVDLKETSQLPPMFEPLMIELHAQLSYSPVMTAADLKTGLSQLH
jgi:hypothetical protein